MSATKVDRTSAYLNMVALLSQADSCGEASNASANDKDCESIALRCMRDIDTVYLERSHVDLQTKLKRIVRTVPR